MQKQLPNGLILRTLSENHASDWERLPDFYASVNTAGEPDNIQEGVRHWTRFLMNGHPTVTPEDMFLIVDPAQDDLIVSATLLIPQTWRYEGITIPVGRPELVGTLPDYRNRRLVRALFDAVHERSAALGHQLQVITGIPYFYRRFGYTMAVERGEHSIFQFACLSDLAPDYKPAYTLRPAVPDDVPAILEWSDYLARQRLLSDAFTPEQLSYEITGRLPRYYPHTAYLVIMDAEGHGVGFLSLLTSLEDPFELRCGAYVVGDQTSYLATFGDVLRALKKWAVEFYGHCPAMLVFSNGMHDAVDRWVERTFGGSIRPREYAWYLRVPDTIGFLRLITPVLEKRLEGSGAHRYTGNLPIGFYNQNGISLQFEAGQLKDIVPISGKDGYDISYPWNLFWNVVFGYRTTDEILHTLPDVYANAKATILLDALFPKKKSWLRGLT